MKATTLVLVLVVVCWGLVEVNGDIIDFDSYHNYTVLTHYLKNITDTYSSVCKLSSIGQSVEKRELWVVKITNVSSLQTPSFKYIGNMHGNEVVGRELLLHLVDYLCSNFESDPEVNYLVNNFQIYILPSMNPDGFENESRSNANGVDLNRDFPDQFIDPPTTNFGLDNRQPETLAVMQWSLFDTQFHLSANLHGSATVICVNYGFDSNPQNLSGLYNPAPDDIAFRLISTIYSNNHRTMWNQTSVAFLGGITNGAAWYCLSGGMADWSYLYAGSIEVTVEVSFPYWPPANLLLSYWLDNKQSLLSYMLALEYGISGVVVDNETGQWLNNATVKIKNRPRVLRVGEKNQGYFHFVVESGEYDLEIEGEGYERREIKGIRVLEGLKSQKITYGLKKREEDEGRWRWWLIVGSILLAAFIVGIVLLAAIWFGRKIVRRKVKGGGAWSEEGGEVAPLWGGSGDDVNLAKR